MESQNNNNDPRNIKRKLYEKINCEEIIENRENIKIINAQQKHILKNLVPKSIKNDYIERKKEKLVINILKRKNNKNNVKRTLIKELKTSKFFTQTIKKLNLLLINFLIFINSFSFIFANDNYQMKKFNFLNEITIKIIGSDIQNVLYISIFNLNLLVLEYEVFYCILIFDINYALLKFCCHYLSYNYLIFLVSPFLLYYYYYYCYY